MGFLEHADCVVLTLGEDFAELQYKDYKDIRNTLGGKPSNREIVDYMDSQPKVYRMIREGVDGGILRYETI